MMDNGSVISLSSSSPPSSSKGSSDSLASILTISSETARIPVSWESSNQLSKGASTVLSKETALNHSEKVNHWMNSCEYQSQSCVSPENSSTNQKSTCIRYDFDKSPRAASIPKSCFTRTRPLFSYMEEAKKNNSQETRPKSVGPDRCNGNKTSCDTPLSPDSHKKELCNYLQLMKPDDKQHNFFIEHRRSGRVINQNLNNANKDINKASSEANYPALKSLKELNIKGVFSVKHKNNKDLPNKYLPLPPKRVYLEVCDFEDSVNEIVNERQEKENHANGVVRKVEKRRKFNFGLQKLKNCRFISKRFLSLRSKRHLRNTSINSSILKRAHVKKKARKKLLKQSKEKIFAAKKSDSIEISPRCEIISIYTNSDDENVDLKNFVDDMLELDKMSEEHRKSVIESRILASSSIANLIKQRTSKEADVQKAYKIFSDLSKSSEEKENTQESSVASNHDADNVAITDTEIVTLEEDEECSAETQQDNNHSNSQEESRKSVIMDQIISEHDYTNLCEEVTTEDDDNEEDDRSAAGSLNPVPIPNLEVLPVKKGIETKSLLRSLSFKKRKSFLSNYGLHSWSSGSNSENRKLNHAITTSVRDGTILRACYQDYNLIIAQQSCVSFWTQSALGSVLGAQNMWVPKGQIQRIPLNTTYVQKKAIDVVITTETSIAYVELWTKEHKSDVREVPVADVFAIVYFWRLRQNGLEKKALQLENIKGFSEDVQYCVLKFYPRIIVSWHCIQGGEKKTKIHSYHLAADFQTVASINEIQPVQHYVSSLHNIEDCDSMVMGCGENKITLWNVEYGTIVATIEMSDIKFPLATLWVKSDRGFLFIVQECGDQELRLIAVNGLNHSWKKLQNYGPLQGFDCVKGVCIENGILVAYYAQGILCWNAQTGDLIVEELLTEGVYIPSGKHVITIVNENIIVRHSLCHLITDL